MLDGVIVYFLRCGNGIVVNHIRECLFWGDDFEVFKGEEAN